MQPQIVSTSRTFNDLVFLVEGYSLAQFLAYSHSASGFLRAMMAATHLTHPNGIELFTVAVGGSVLSAYMRQKGIDANWAFDPIIDASVLTTRKYHVKDTVFPFEDGTDPAESVFASNSARLTGRAVGNKPQAVILGVGIVDAELFGVANLDIATCKTKIYNSLIYKIGRARTYCVNGNTSNTPVIIHDLCRLNAGSVHDYTMGLQIVRQAIRRVCNDMPGVYGVDTYHAMLYDGLHYSTVSERDIGRAVAEVYMQKKLGLTSYVDLDGATRTLYDAPYISAVNVLDSTHVQVTVTPGGADAIDYPATLTDIPCGFGFGLVGADYSLQYGTADLLGQIRLPPVKQAVSCVRTNNVLTFTVPENYTDLFFPYNTVMDYHPRRLIVGRHSRKPLRTRLDQIGSALV